MGKTDFTGEVVHFGAVRYRITGSADFKSSLISLDDVITNALPDITLAATNSREPTILANFNQQRAYLQGKTTKINETFVISRIIVYVRPVASGYPT